LDIVNKNGAGTLAAAKASESNNVIALAGNPNVGKSTVFNHLTGMNQHTGNWPGKTVTGAKGVHRFRDNHYILVDLPGTYSIMAHSVEEEVARNFILFGGAAATIVICDATCLERNLNLVLQVMEITPNIIVCVNLLDEAKKKKISIDLPALEKELGVPVVGTSARSGKGLAKLMEKVEALCAGEILPTPRKVRYDTKVTEAIAPLTDILKEKLNGILNSTWLALRLLEKDESLIGGIHTYLGYNLLKDPHINSAVDKARNTLDGAGITEETLKDTIVSRVVLCAEEISLSVLPSCKKCSGCGECARAGGCMGVNLSGRDRKLDRILTSKLTGIPIMLMILCVVFWITLTGAEYPSQAIASGLFWLEDRLTDFLLWLGSPQWVHGLLVLGVYRVLAWVVAVMLPPMAIFFPLFTLLEDFGYLPRVAFNLDHHFKKAKACCKQALTMCMGNICYPLVSPMKRQKILAIWRFFFPSGVCS
jgi:ferrous iron transport protein B